MLDCTKYYCYYQRVGPYGYIKCNSCRQHDLNDKLWNMTRMWKDKPRMGVDVLVSIAMYLNNTDYGLYHTDRSVRHNMKSVMESMMEMQDWLPSRKRRKLSFKE